MSIYVYTENGDEICIGEREELNDGVFDRYSAFCACAMGWDRISIELITLVSEILKDQDNVIEFLKDHMGQTWYVRDGSYEYTRIFRGIDKIMSGIRNLSGVGEIISGALDLTSIAEKVNEATQIGNKSVVDKPSGKETTENSSSDI